MTDLPTTAVYIYGSCLSRDTIASLKPGAAKVTGYIARHSILSEGTDASYKLPSDLELESSFQVRMMMSDWRGKPLDEFFDKAEEIDIFLWDLVDERLGVHWFLSGEVVTRSLELLKSVPAKSVIEPGTHIAFGGDIHFENWCEKVNIFVDRLRKAGSLFEKTRLLKVNWAETSLNGEDVPPSMGIDSVKANKLYSRYYDYIESLGVKIIEVPSEIAVADPEHRWGHAPFHYQEAVYQFIIKNLNLDGLIGERG